jgi:hypothetical protein
MSDIPKAVATAFGVLGLKPRSAQTIIAHWKSKGIETSDEGGFLSLSQNGNQFDVAQALQSTFKQNPELFVGHAGEVRFRSDILDTAAKVEYVRKFGLAQFAALPATKDSPGAGAVLAPTIASTEMDFKSWLTLTSEEKTAAIKSWGVNGRKNVEVICARK